MENTHTISGGIHLRSAQEKQEQLDKDITLNSQAVLEEKLSYDVEYQILQELEDKGKVSATKLQQNITMI